MRCSECGSLNLEFGSAEFSFADDANDFVYSLQSTALCLDCGLCTSCMSPDAVEKLRKKRSVGHVPKGTRDECPVCDSNDIAAFDAVEITFGTKLVSPVHLDKGATVSVCFDCGLSEFTVAKQDLEEMKIRIGVRARPPELAPRAKRVRGAA